MLLAPLALAQTTDDEAMLASINEDQYRDFKTILEEGYDPNKFIEGRVQSWLMCDATRPDRIEFLKFAVKMGGNVNLVKPRISQLYSAPIMCAISYKNKVALDYLLANGADPNIVVCPECEKIHRVSPMQGALFTQQYQMAYELIALTDVTDLEIEVARSMLENGRYRPDPEESQEEYRLKIAAYLESKGYELNIWTHEKEWSGEWLPLFLRDK
jgi:hypothetical protein